MGGTEPLEAARPARPEDLPRLADLLAEALDAIAAARGGRELLDEEAAALSDPGALRRLHRARDALVAGGWYEGTLVGLAVAHVTPSRSGARRGVVDLVYVEPGAREMGVGELLLRAVIEWCAEQSCATVDALALPGDRETKSLLERHAFRARKVVMSRPVAGRGAHRPRLTP